MIPGLVFKALEGAVVGSRWPGSRALVPDLSAAVLILDGALDGCDAVLYAEGTFVTGPEGRIDFDDPVLDLMAAGEAGVVPQWLVDKFAPFADVEVFPGP